MKLVFKVTFSDEEPPAYQIANDAEDALNETLAYANEMHLPTIDHPTVDREGEYPDFDDFCESFTLLKNPLDPYSALNGCVFNWVGAEWEIVRKSRPENLWTLTESEGLWWISPGFHSVNRLGYLLTKEPRKSDEVQYVYE